MLSRRLQACDYSLKADGRGTVAARFADGSAFTLAMVVSDNARQISYISLEPNTAKPGTMYRQHGADPRPFSRRTLRGTWGLHTSAVFGELDIAFAGLARFDGRGKCSVILNENNAAEPAHQHRSVSCTYSVNKDGRGTMRDKLDDGITESRTFVISEDGRRLSFLVTALPTILGSGEMTRQ